MKILSVDDDPDNLYLIQRLCHSQGHEVVSAHNGVEALEHLAAGSFDLIISDILMPQMDGFQFCRTVKLSEHLRRIPFIFYSATYTSQEDEQLALSLGASRFVIKPARPEEFIEVIRQVVREGASKQLPAPTANDDTHETLKLYNQALIRKLENKIEQLESARASLAKLVAENDRESAGRRLAEDALRRSEKNFLKAFLSNPAAIAINDLAEHRYVEINKAFEQLTGHSRADVIGKQWDEVELWADRSKRDEAFRLLFEQGSLRNLEFQFRRKDGKTGTGLLSGELIEFDGRVCAITAKMDITERLQLQNQLQHAQRLESIGRLAGGVAHDFNNILTVIAGYNSMVLGEMDPGSHVMSYAEEIQRAAAMAATLTQQLLAFSRKQVIAVRPVNMNTVVTDAERMLQRVIGEDINLVTNLDAELGHVMADAGQMHQVIMNLAVNARDAMPEGGMLVIETANLDLEEHTVFGLPKPVTGSYVLVKVFDTGSGMNEEVLQNIFEPFFTTKERGRGTGLGLSTVYGIVRQSSGWIEVASETGKGTAFKIFFPRIEADIREESAAPALTLDVKPGCGTVLVAEDDDTVRELTVTMLRKAGYKVISAGNGMEALKAAQESPDAIDILLTDVIMPGMNGKQLWERLRSEQPRLKAIYMSGYTDDVIAPRGVLDPSVAYIAKPFSQDVLARKIREVLNEAGESRAEAAGQA